jgi:NitT/TauT family transport system ATP-binding protein
MEANTMRDIVIQDVSKCFGDKKIFDALNYSFCEHKVTAITGPSGSGKTTLLRMIAGLDKAYSGKIINEYDRIAFVFQEYRLLDWLTVYENIAFVVDEDPITPELDDQIMSLLRMVELQDFRDYFPSELSGGMKQRVSLCRALIFPGNLLLMDEPFTSLDHEMKHRVSDQLLDYVRQTNRTALFVTHDLEMAKKADLNYQVM